MNIPDGTTPQAPQSVWNAKFFELVAHGFTLTGGDHDDDEPAPAEPEADPAKKKRRRKPSRAGEVPAQKVVGYAAVCQQTRWRDADVKDPEFDPDSEAVGWEDANPATAMASVARGFLVCKKHYGHPVLYREGLGWYLYNGTRYVLHTDEEFEQRLYQFFAPLKYGKYDSSSKEMKFVQFNPDGAFLTKCRVSIRAQALKKGLAHDTWTDGRKNRTVALRNGLFDLESDVFTAGHDPSFFNTATLPFDYDARAYAWRWGQFLEEVWPGDPDAHALLQEWFGYVLSGRTDLQQMLMVMGMPGTGKGVISKVLENLVGEDNFSAVESETLTGRFGLATLADRTLGIFYDASVLTSGKAFTERLKTITGGDAVVLEKKNKDPFTARLPTRFTFFSNDVPTLPDASSAILTRVLALHTEVMWRGAVGQKTDLFENELLPELPGIFNWALEGLARLNASRGRFTHAHSGDRVLSELRAGTSPLQQFVEAECVVAPDNRVAKDDLYREWKTWAGDNGHHPGSSADFGKKLFAAYGTAISKGHVGGRGDQRAAYRGISLQDNDFQDGLRRVK